MCEEVTSNERKVPKELPGLCIGKDESEECLEVVDGLASICCRLFLVNGREGGRILLCACVVRASGVPKEVLEEFVCVLLCDDLACSLDDVSNVLDETLAVWGQLGDVHGCVLGDILEGLIDLGVVWVSTFSESLDDTVEAKL